MNQSLAISRKELKSIAGSIRDEGQTVVDFTDEFGETRRVTKAQLLSALVWQEAMPFNKETGEYELGSARYVEMVHSCDPKDEDGSIDALTKALEAVSLKMSENRKPEIEEPEIRDAEIIQDAEVVEGDDV